MVRLKVKVGPKGQVVIPKAIREKLGIDTGKYLAIDESNGKIILEKSDINELIDWLKRNRKKVAKDVYKVSVEDEF